MISKANKSKGKPTKNSSAKKTKLKKISKKLQKLKVGGRIGNCWGPCNCGSLGATRVPDTN